MREFEMPPTVPAAGKAIHRVSYWLNSQRQGVIWLLVGLATCAVTVADLMTYGLRLDVGIFYVVPIALVCWIFRLTKALLATAAILFISLAIYPLLHEDVGVLAMMGDGAIRTAAFCAIAAIILSYRQIFDHAQSLATHDRMTGALNKATFNDRVGKTLTRAQQERDTLLLLLLDLDGFKAVNDGYGHPAGDLVLQEFSREARSVLRPGDSFGRLGGDEFGVALTATSISAAQELAETLQQRFVAILRRCRYPVTCSMGGLIVPSTTRSSLLDLMVEVDLLMYAAKANGKNCLQIETTDRPLRAEVKPPPLVPDLPKPNESDSEIQGLDSPSKVHVK